MYHTLKDQITWIDIMSPTEDDFTFLRKNFPLHPITLKELKGASARSKVELHNKYLYLAMHFPMWDENHQIGQPWEIDMVIFKDTVITLSYQEIEAHQELMEKTYQKDFEYYLSNTAILLNFILNHYLADTRHQLARLEKNLKTIEEDIFKGKQQEIISALSITKRDILNFRLISRYLAEEMCSLNRNGSRFLGESAEIYLGDIEGEATSIENLIENIKDTADSLESTNNSLLEQKINSLTKVFTVISFIGWPTLLIISSYQMNVRFLPLIGLPYDYFIILGIAFLPSLILYIYLKIKKML